MQGRFRTASRSRERAILLILQQEAITSAISARNTERAILRSAYHFAMLGYGQADTKLASRLTGEQLGRKA